MCALFFNLSPEDDNGTFWEGIIVNFWVAIFSTVFILVALLGLGCLIATPKSWKRKFQKADTVEEVKSVHSTLAC